MINPDENEWSRFHRIREDLSELPATDVRTRLEQLKAGGETSTVISMLELHFRLNRTLELEPGRRLASHYTIREKIGEGGMGVVYRATQDITNQEVALKVIHPALVSSRLIKRFHEEISTLGKLRHDHIVRVFDAQQESDKAREFDLLFYAMQLVDGVSLTRWVRETQPAIEERLDCFIRICDAVDYAHRNGVIHRDLKPDNILVDAQGRPAILDFGLAQVADAAFELPTGAATAEGDTVLQVSGTPSYLSRERWDGQPGGVPADVFALGVILHEILTGGRPWRVAKNAPINDLRRAIRDFSIRQLSSQQRKLGRDLIELMGAMLAPRPELRPASAAEVATRLRAVVRRRRWFARLRRTAPVWGSLMVAAISILITQAYYLHRDAILNESRSRLRAAEDILREPARLDMLDQVVGLLPVDPGRRHSQDEWRDALIGAMSHWNLRWREAFTFPLDFKLLAANPDGRSFFGQSFGERATLLMSAGSAWTVRDNGGLGKPVRARFHPQRSELVVLESSGRLARWNWELGNTITILESVGTDAQFEFSPDGRFLAVTVQTLDPTGFDLEPVTEARIYDAETWREKHVLAGRGEPTEPGSFVNFWTRSMDGLAFSPDGQFLAAWSDSSQNLPVWDMEDGKRVAYAFQADGVAAAAWRPGSDTDELAIITNGGRIRSWKIPELPGQVPASSPKSIGVFSLSAIHPKFVGWLAWTPRGEELIAINQHYREVALFHTRPGDEGTDAYQSARLAEPLVWVSGGRFVETAGGGRWERPVVEPPIHRTAPAALLGPASLSFSSDGRLLAAADSGSITLLDASELRELHRITDLPNNPPPQFEPVTGDLWAYGKTGGLIRWTLRESDDEMVLHRVDRAADGGVGRLAVAAGFVATSKGTAVRVHQVSALGEPARWPDIQLYESPAELALADGGGSLAAYWLNPLRAGLWIRHEAEWRLSRLLTNAPVLNGLYEWNGTNGIIIPLALQRTEAEEDEPLHVRHWPEGTLVTGAARAPVVVSSVERDRGVHVDVLIGGHCRHFAVFPVENDRGRFAVTMAVSPDGSRVAAVHRDGYLRLWDLRLLHARLKELRLEVPGFDLGAPTGRPPVRAVREVVEK